MTKAIDNGGSNVWYARFRVNGKNKKPSTLVPIYPDVLPKGCTKEAWKKKSKAIADQIAEQLEIYYNGGRVDMAKVISLIGEVKARKLFPYGNSVCPSVESYLRDWMLKRANMRRLTGKSIQQADNRDNVAVDLFLKFLGERKSMGIDMVKREDVQEFIAVQIERVSSGTVRNYRNSLSVAFGEAVKNELLSKNVFSGVEIPKCDDVNEKDAFTLEQIKLMLDNFPEDWADMVRVCLYTGGQRLGDIATLKWEQIDLDTEYIRMTTQKTKRAMGKPIIEPLKKVFVRRIACRVSGYVFPVQASRFFQAGGKSNKLSIEFGNLLKKIGLRDMNSNKAKGDRRVVNSLSFHSLRATAVTVLRNAGVPADLCRHIVGHDSEEIERIYFRPADSTVAEAMKHIDIE